MSRRRVVYMVAAGHPGAEGAAGAATGAATHSGQVPMAQGSGRGTAHGAARGKAVRPAEAQPHVGDRLHLPMGMPKASRAVSIAA